MEVDQHSAQQRVGAATGLIAWLPNLISFARLLAVPVILYLILTDGTVPAFWLFIAAGVSDAVDGLIAKQFRVESEIGSYLDPLADKALLAGVYVTLAVVGAIPLWLVFLIVFRDLMIIGGVLLFHTLTRTLKIQPLFISKTNTLFQIVLAGLILAKDGLGLEWDYGLRMMMYLVAATTFLSGAEYVLRWGYRAVTMERGE